MSQIYPAPCRPKTSISQPAKISPSTAPAPPLGGQVTDGEQLGREVGLLLSEPETLAKRRQAARAWSEAEAGILDQVEGALAPFLAGVEKAHARP